MERYGEWLRTALESRGQLGQEVPYALKSILGGPNLRTGDGVSAAWVEACGRSKLRWAGRVKREQRALFAAERVVAISPMVAAELERWHGVRSTVVLNPVFAPPQSRVAGPRLLFVGHDFARKGLRVLLSALAMDASLSLDVVGNDAHGARWRRRAGALGDRVRFLGDRDASPLIAQAAALVHPALYEPYGNVVAEAVAAGTPVVASDRTGAQVLLHPDHVWSDDRGPAGLLEQIHGALTVPQPTVAVPNETQHLSQLNAALFG